VLLQHDVNIGGTCRNPFVELNEVVPKMNLEFRFKADGPGTLAMKPTLGPDLFREGLPSWDAQQKLKFWVAY
jgi:hypothetical protein